MEVTVEVLPVESKSVTSLQINDVRYPADKNWATFRCDILQVNGYVCQTVNQGDFCGVVVEEDQESNQNQTDTGSGDSKPDDADPDSAPSQTVCLGIGFPMRINSQIYISLVDALHVTPTKLNKIEHYFKQNCRLTLFC